MSVSNIESTRSTSKKDSYPTVAIVVPCFNEEEVLPETCRVLKDKLDQLINQQAIASDSSVYFVDDGSSDNTWQLIESMAEQYGFHGIKLSRNRGHQNALLAGLLTVEEDVVISLDADLQDDIDAIDQMLEEHMKGAEIVYAVRSSRTTDTPFKRLTAESYYHLLKKMGVDLVFNHADYRLMSRRSLEALREYKESNLFLRGMIPLLGFQSSTVEFERAERFAGESKYPIGKMLKLAWEGITSFSEIPLRVITVMGFSVSILSLLMLAWVLVVRLFTDSAVPGWASTIIPVFFLGGVQLLSLGVIGEYIAKIYTETKARPKFQIEKTI